MRWLIILSAAWSMTACNYNKVKSTGQGSKGANVSTKGVPDYATVQAAIIGPKCVSCHSDAGGNKGSTNLESLKSLRGSLKRALYRVEQTQDMPPGAPLSEAEVGMLRRWADSGAPEIIVVGEKPNEDLASGPDNWTKVRDHIFEGKCQPCHQGDQPDGGLDLTSLAMVRDKADIIFKRTIILADMPVTPLPQLTQPERDVLWNWFNSGMPE